jgi:CRISPR system Cascade subunit CasA
MDLPSFSLLDDPWIPVEREGKLQDVSLWELFRTSESLGRVRAENPLITASLYRLLLAILYRTQGPKGLAIGQSNGRRGLTGTQT